MELLMIWLLMAILGAMILNRYKKALTGFLLGGLLGPIGLIAALVIRSDESKKEDHIRHEEQLKAIGDAKSQQASSVKLEPRFERECPYCAEKILLKAKICKHCGRDVDLSKA